MRNLTRSRPCRGCFLNGQKTFITNGILSDVVIVVAKTAPEKRHKGIGLLVVERGMKGSERGRELNKMGLKAQDTADLYFVNVRVPMQNMLGEEGQGFYYAMHHLAEERLSFAILSATWNCALASKPFSNRPEHL